MLMSISLVMLPQEQTHVESCSCSGISVMPLSSLHYWQVTMVTLTLARPLCRATSKQASLDLFFIVQARMQSNLKPFLTI